MTTMTVERTTFLIEEGTRVQHGDADLLLALRRIAYATVEADTDQIRLRELLQGIAKTALMNAEVR